MTIGELMHTLGRGWRILVAAVLLTVAAAAAVLARTPSEYEANLQMFVSATAAGSQLGGAYQGSLFTQDRVASYAELVNTPEVTEQVVRNLRLSLSPAQVARRIKAEVPDGTVLLNVTVTDRNPKMARDIANAVGFAFPRVLGGVERSADTGAPLVAATVVRPAVTPTSPASPHRGLDLLLASLLGLGIGVTIVLIRDAMDVTVRSEEDLDGVVAASVLTELPRSALRHRNRRARTLPPETPAAEAYRRLRTNLQFTDDDGVPATILVTSANAKDGKSSVCLGMARTFLRSGLSVVVVDADLRCGGFSKLLGLADAPGLADVLIGQRDLRGALVTTDGLFVLPAGSRTASLATDLLQAPAMTRVLTELRKRADVVIIDSPPVLPVTDAAVIAPQVDAVLLVVRHGTTRRSDLRHAAVRLQHVGGDIQGVILVGVPAKGRGRDRKYYQQRSASASQPPPVMVPVSAASPRPTGSGVIGRSRQYQVDGDLDARLGRGEEHRAHGA